MATIAWSMLHRAWHTIWSISSHLEEGKGENFLQTQYGIQSQLAEGCTISPRLGQGHGGRHFDEIHTESVQEIRILDLLRHGGMGRGKLFALAR
jgi:hypothetical protein